VVSTALTLVWVRGVVRHGMVRCGGARCGAVGRMR
jgi:hypothetical protein